jgi:hypothetical protein
MRNKMCIEVKVAYAMGILLPVLEVIRRRTDFSDIPGYIDDFLIGAFLLYAARSVSRPKSNGRVLLVAAWAVLCGGFYSSFFHQLQSSAPHDVSGYSNMLVVFIKGVLYLIAIGCLVLSIRSAVRSEHG